MRGSFFLSLHCRSYLLANSGRHPLARDETGASFIDRSGRLFEYVLQFLRTGTVIGVTDANLRAELAQEAAYFQLKGLQVLLSEAGPSSLCRNASQVGAGGVISHSEWHRDLCLQTTAALAKSSSPSIQQIVWPTHPCGEWACLDMRQVRPGCRVGNLFLTLIPASLGCLSGGVHVQLLTEILSV